MSCAVKDNESNRVGATTLGCVWSVGGRFLAPAQELHDLSPQTAIIMRVKRAENAMLVFAHMGEWVAVRSEDIMVEEGSPGRPLAAGRSARVIIASIIAVKGWSGPGLKASHQ